ncbi:GNAT family N-acetyltransferase [Nocardioides sp. S-58]|uniref:GNAT family N-acetyltransferase n=1 Tax=Nocardioides renjunii TaxID=3095075 RepID=A0ABU5KEC8_9ACTN|nr:MULTISPECIES: GNAT family N-acetyltransferase [unclassified Nocardioides]MDZ5662915.1 GNAT family N-acetyltransferase [Nocardioides sp. S-58]WQQ23211.1 GNAT family N-acetyltransferase [Nocardioides sp. S-34]
MVDIEQINPRNQAALRAWWEVGAAATAERPGKPWPLWDQSRVALPADNPERAVTLIGAIDGREMVGAGLLTRPLRENLHTAMAFAYVRPDRTREGIGRRLVEELEVVAAGDGRSTIQSEAYLPPGGTGASEAFARAMGYDVASREAIKELTLTDYLARRDALAVEASAADAYRVITFDTVCPEEHLDSFGRLLGMLMSEVPLGELDLAASEWTPERIRDAEQRQVDVGRHVQTAMAIAPDGSVAGVSDVRVDDSDPAYGQVGITIVDPAHRGHRLGLALKLATHDLAVATYPDLVSLDTSNAEVNTWMNAVNEALGYRTIETLLELQKKR